MARAEARGRGWSPPSRSGFFFDAIGRVLEVMRSGCSQGFSPNWVQAIVRESAVAPPRHGSDSIGTRPRLGLRPAGRRLGLDDRLHACSHGQSRIPSAGSTYPIEVESIKHTTTGLKVTFLIADADWGDLIILCQIKKVVLSFYRGACSGCDSGERKDMHCSLDSSSRNR